MRGGWIAGLAVTLWASNASARPVRDAIEITEHGCLDTVATQVATWLKTDDLDPRLRIVVEGNASRAVEFRVERDGEVVGRRAFDTKGIACPNVSALVSLAIAMAIDATPLTSVEVPPSAPVLPQRPHPPSSRTTDTPQITIGLETSALLGILPHPAIGGALAFGASFNKHLWFRGAALESTTAGAPLGVGRVDASLAEAEAGLCLALPTPGVVWRACAGAALGRLVASGSGFDRSTTATFVWIAATLRVDTLIHIAGVLHLALFVEQVLPLPSPIELDVQKGDRVMASTTLPSAGLATGLGPVLQFQ